eukprot:825895-Pyramimonas_sp.AAC.1
MWCVAVLDLYVAVPRSDKNMTPGGVVPRDGARAVPASPIIFCSSGAMIVNQIPLAIIVLTNDSGLGP